MGLWLDTVCGMIHIEDTPYENLCAVNVYWLLQLSVPVRTTSGSVATIADEPLLSEEKMVIQIRPYKKDKEAKDHW